MTGSHSADHAEAARPQLYSRCTARQGQNAAHTHTQGPSVSSPHPRTTLQSMLTHLVNSAVHYYYK